MASGIAEHHEALRRQHLVNKRAMIAKQLMEQYGEDYVPDLRVYYPRERYVSKQADDDDHKLCIRKMGSPPGLGDYKAPITDK